jgi:CRP/FNR family transcriptional regulator, anaerobic regulatory protein
MPTRRFQLVAEPRIAAIPFRGRARGKPVSLLSAEETRALAAIGEIVRLRKGATVYDAATACDAVYNLVQGVAKTYQVLADRTVHVSGFLFPGDVFGLAEQGHYVETAEAVVPIVAYKIPLAAFEDLVTTNGALATHMLCKLAHELRAQQHHALILNRHDAAGRLAMFLDFLERAELTRGPNGAIYFPMTRSDAADFVGLTLEAVSRAFNALEKQGLVAFVDRHHFHVTDREQLQALVAGISTLPPAQRKAQAFHAAEGGAPPLRPAARVGTK